MLKESIDVILCMLYSMELTEPGIKKGVRETAVRTSAGTSKSAVAAKKRVKPR
jgi:hypothetical protein